MASSIVDLLPDYSKIVGTLLESVIPGFYYENNTWVL